MSQTRPSVLPSSGPELDDGSTARPGSIARGEESREVLMPRVTVPGYPSSEWLEGKATLEGKAAPVEEQIETGPNGVGSLEPASARRSQKPAESRNGDQIQSEILRRLEEEADLDSAQVLVSVSDGEVILEGHVANQDAEQKVETIARGVAGVARVHNRLVPGKSVLTEIGERLWGADAAD